MKCMPERGRIGIFNRSYYEETLVVRVHQDFLEKQKLPPRPDHEGHLERTLSGHSQLRALPDAQRRRHSQIFSACLQQRAKKALSRAHRRAREKLEVFSE